MIDSAHVLQVGYRVEKTGGDYRFAGEVRAVFTKRNGVVRYVVENDDGILHIFSAANIGHEHPFDDEACKQLKKMWEQEHGR
jgi:hypothetical protein